MSALYPAALPLPSKPLNDAIGVVHRTLYSSAWLDLTSGPHPPHPTDWSLVAQMRRLGLAAGARLAGLEPGVRSALNDVPAAALQAMCEAFPRMAKVVNGWQMNIDTIGVYGNFYLKRAVITMVGLGANSPEDAVYPILLADADGKPWPETTTTSSISARA